VLQMQNILIKGHETKGHSRKMCMKAQKGRVYSSNPFEISALGGTGRLAPRPGRFTPPNPQEWAGVERCGKSRLHQHSNPRPTARSESLRIYEAPINYE